VDNHKQSALYWAPRVIGIGAALFLAMFALDVFSEGYSLGELLVAFFIHLIPSFVIIIVLVIAWRWERFGGGLFIFLGLLYIWLFWDPGRWIAYLVISGPLLFSGGLFLLNHWITQGKQSEMDGEESM
jgi:hypothetical protein